MKDVTLFALAIWGAGLSTMNWWQSRLREKRRIQVSLQTMMLTYTNGTLGAPYAQIQAVNAGHRDVTITSIALEVEGQRLVAMSSDSFPAKPDTRLPVILKDGASAHLLMSYADIGQALIYSGRRAKVDVIPIAEDSLGVTHRGKPWHVDPVEFTTIK